LAFLGHALLASQPTALVAVQFELDVILEIQPRRDVIAKSGPGVNTTSWPILNLWLVGGCGVLMTS
jgi:hypothetical protein